MGHISVLQALYDQEPKINLNLADKSSAITMLYAHSSNRSTETISWLIEHGVDPNVRIGINGADMLQVACIFGRFQLAKAYIHAGARCDSKLKLTSEVAAFTPLERCCMTGHPSVLGVAALNIFGSRDTRNSSYFSAPDSEVDRASLVALMVEKGARIRGSRPGDGLFEPSPMVLAAQNHLVPIMEILIKTGTGVGVMDHLGMFPLCAPLHGDYAARQPPTHAQMSRTINWLLDHDADIEQKSSTHQVLYCLCNRPGYQTAEQISEQLELAQLFIDKGAVVDSMVIDPSLPESQQNSSALMAAFRRGRMSLCDLLIQSGAVFPSDADSLLHLLEGLLSNHKPFYQNEDFVPVDFSGEQEDCIDMFGPKWKEWSHPEKRTMLSGLRKKIFDGLDLLHSHDKHHMLAKHPRCLWIAAGVPGSPLVGKFLEAGALDASWVEEGRNCLDQLSQNPVSLVYHAEKFIALGAGPPGQSLLYHLIAGRKQFRDTKSWYLLQLFFSNGAKLDLCNRPTDYMGRQSPLALLTMNLSSVEDDYKGFELVLQSLSRPISETPDQGYGALLAACSHPIHPRPIKALIAAGVDVNYAPPRGSSVPSRLVILFKDLLEYFAAGASEDDYERLYESIDEDGDEYEDCYDDEKIDFGQAGHMLDALKILIDNGAQFRESDPSLKGLYDILLDISKDEREVWSTIRDPDAQENAKEFIEGIRIEIEERVSWEGEKLLIVDRE
ncbi:hypothetical protein PFICI_10374 [Pestalotiopsis fici W106-1]|uniref:Uncharacterized protein n=1 Tax=Pestalotiopsis fici (strain W106-1 / CGMCC3.15140) TaxID=1229662 RepID=W3WYY0_PESFW|nr:uncharacterized protein PFICI_10374 [Pestalotiopsis fici W106-1]ETS78312.1 hypothetical protein PFICI_10374 [Pestalotiopsis fici W106-1]